MSVSDPMGLGLLEDMKPRQRKPSSDVEISTLQMLGFGVPCSDSDWTQPNNHLLHGGGGGGGDCNSMLQEEDYQKHKDWNSPPKSFSSEEDDSSPSSFNIINASGFVPAAHNSLQTLLEPQQQDTSLFNNSYSYSYSPSPNSWQKLSPFLQHEPPAVASNTPFWNVQPLSDDTFFPPQSQVGESTSVARKCNSSDHQPAYKKPRMETPSPLPTFKIRKEKLGDRITALQQLVSPFGKTDTASVLHEAIEYIKFLHDQVSVLTTPYMKIGSPLQHQHKHQHQHQQMQGSCHHNHQKESEKGGEDLRSRGLCLVPISSTFPVGSESSPDFWTPTFGATLRYK